MPVLTAIDVLRVQRFIFLSNRLRDVVTGSYLVSWSTSKYGALKNLVDPKRILLAGGGNAIIEFDDIAAARSFSAQYTRLLHEQAPGLEVAVVHRLFENNQLAQALQEIQIEIARLKTERLPSVPILGISVTASCRETGFPASGFDRSDPTVPLSREILKRREKKDEATLHWISYLDDRDEFAFPMELDDLGRTIGDTSLIGVVHVDGNRVGKKIRDWLYEKFDSGESDDTVRREYLEWSQAIENLGKKALQTIVDRLCNSVEKKIRDGKESVWITGKPSQLGFELKKVENNWMLPLRPILVGGDDITFVCDGRIALNLAETALEVFNNSDVPHLGKISACAGVAIVRVHTPFARAYELAEKLCGSAKRMLKDKNESGCALDWHIGNCRPGETVESIRERQYIANGCRLTCRPYLLDSKKDKTETWKWLSRELLDDDRVGLRSGVWSSRRSKVNAFAGLVRKGPESVQSALNAWKVVDKNLRLPVPIAEDGFLAGTRTPLIDALELIDLHLVLEPS